MMAIAEEGVPIGMTSWSHAAEQLLCEVLLSFADMSKLEFRHSLLKRMTSTFAARGIADEVREIPQPKAHVKELMTKAGSRGDPLGVLEALVEALTELSPYDGALPWLKVVVTSLTEEKPLPAERMVPLVRALRALSPAPRPHTLMPYIAAAGKGLSLLQGGETLAEVLQRTAELRHDMGRRALLGFLHAFANDTQNPLNEKMTAIRAVLGHMKESEGSDHVHSQPSDSDYRLILQIRLEAEDAEHVEDGRYSLHATCYKQPRNGGKIVRISKLPQPTTLRRSQLLSSGSRPLSEWHDLAEEMTRVEKLVRIEFLLPASLLGHPAELWSTGAAQQSLGHHHPVVVRSLERYKDTFIGMGPWIQRWSHLRHSDKAADALDLIGWPSMDAVKASELTEWIIDRPALACLGLRQPYEQLPAPMRRAVDDAMFTEGVPVVIWRRDAGQPEEIIKALREHAPAHLADLPDVVHQCRRRGRTAESDDVRNNITLLWEDPDCVDKGQDQRFAGMV
ncbi:hypothetical protein ABZX74_05475 [Streptomyces olivaceoviridis]|uniref:VMAP-C domain-containing protein n=1 Tax=Streptomyces olivaceoviridis TaxID=1921 RepID=UPI0033AF756E